MIIITLLQYKSRSTSLNIRFVDWLMSFSSLLLVVLLAVIVKAKKKERDDEICRHCCCRLTLLHNNNSISRRLVQVRNSGSFYAWHPSLSLGCYPIPYNVSFCAHKGCNSIIEQFMVLNHGVAKTKDYYSKWWCAKWAKNVFQHHYEQIMPKPSYAYVCDVRNEKWFHYATKTRSKTMHTSTTHNGHKVCRGARTESRTDDYPVQSSN